MLFTMCVIDYMVEAIKYLFMDDTLKCTSGSLYLMIESYIFWKVLNLDCNANCQLFFTCYLSLKYRSKIKSEISLNSQEYSDIIWDFFVRSQFKNFLARFYCFSKKPNIWLKIKSSFFYVETWLLSYEYLICWCILRKLRNIPFQ